MLASQTNNGSKSNDCKNKLSMQGTDSRNLNTKEYSQLKPGSLALIQCHISKKWEKEVRIMAPHEDGLYYVAQGLALGKQYILGRCLLKPHPNHHFQIQEQTN